MSAAAKPNTPWSVKGIEREARETAKELAHREGMTVGAWLNQIIYNSASPKSSSGNVDGIELRDVIVAIEALNARVAEEEQKSQEAINGLSRTFGGVVERLQRLEAGGGAGVGADVVERLSRLEEKSTDRQRVDALRSLERAVTQVALQFEATQKDTLDRLDDHEKKLQKLVDHFEDTQGGGVEGPSVDYLRNAVDGLAARIARAERIAGEASKLKEGAAEPAFVEKTGERLRVLGDEIKRSGDQIRGLETTIVKLSAQIDAAESRSAEGVDAVAKTIIEIREQFEDADSRDAGAGRAAFEAAVAEVAERTESRIEALQASFDSMIDRIETTGFGGVGAVDAATGGRADVAPAPAPAPAPVSGPGPDTAQRAAPAAALAAAPPDVLTAAAPTFVAPSAETDAFVERGDEPGADALAAGFDENAPGADLDDAFAAATDPGADPSSDTGVDHPAADAASEQEDVFDDFDDPFADGADDDADGPASAVAAHADDAFDLDDDDAAGPTSESPASAGPAGDEEDDGDILSAVRRSVGERMDQPAEQVAGAAPGSELDAVLAELEGMGFRDSGGAALKRSAPRGFDPADFSDDDFGGDFGGDDASDTPAAAGFDDEEFDDPAETDDEAAGSGVAGQASAGDEEAASPFSLAELPTAEDDQPADKPTKRQLTPKQRAILAARIRRRRMAEAEAAVEEAPADDPAPAPASTFERDAFEDDEDEEPRRRSLASKLSGVLSGLSGRRSRDDDDVEDEDDDDDGVSADRDEASAGVVRPTARGASEADEADSDDADDDVSLYDDDLEDDDYLDDEDDAPMRRPVALALIGATIVTAGAAACLLRDTFLPSAPETQIAAPASAPVEVPAPGDAVGQAAAPAAALETVEPRDVYFDAVAALKSAATPTDDAAALDLLRRASALGHPPAQLQLGEMYRSGEGVAPDPVEARRLFQEAAAAGNILAMHRAGVMSAQGFGGPVDVAAAMTFFEQAASRGHVDSQYNLGALYHPSGEENADGVQDPERAYFWYSLAANAGDDQAAALAAGVGGAVSAEDRTRVDGEVASWEAIPADPKANEVEPAA